MTNSIQPPVQPDTVPGNEPDFGPLEPLLSDPDVIEIMIDHYDQIYVERAGKVVKVPQQFRDEAQLHAIIEKIATPMGLRVDESHPVADLRLPDGSRVNVVFPPIAIDGAVMNIRKFIGRWTTVQEIVAAGTCTPEIWAFLESCVRGRINIAVSGGAGAGKTTLLNLLCQAIPNDERIIALQYAGELNVTQPRTIRLETRPANLEGKGEISMRDLVINSLKMRPDRIIVGEIHNGEALDLFEAMKTGFDGTMFTVHAANSRDVLARLEVMALTGNPSVPVLAIRESMTHAIDLIVHCERLRDGSQRIMKITEVVGMVEGGIVAMRDLFEFTKAENDLGGGSLAATGIVPQFLSKLTDDGKLLEGLFTTRG